MFTADLSIRGRMPQPWALGYTVPAGQHVTAVTALEWSQTGTQVRLTGTDALATDHHVPSRLPATCTIDTQPPADFAVNGVTCERSVSVFAAAPERVKGLRPAGVMRPVAFGSAPRVC